MKSDETNWPAYLGTLVLALALGLSMAWMSSEPGKPTTTFTADTP